MNMTDHASTNPQKSPLALGVDIGGTKLSLALFDEEHQLLKKVKFPVPREPGQGSAGHIAHSVQSFLSGCNLKAVDLIGTGFIVPGIFYRETGMAWAPNLWGREPVPLRALLGESLPGPLWFDCDRAGYVLGENWAGIAQGLSNVVFMAVGTGIGLGILTDGKICRGASDIAGAIGWMAVDPRFKPVYRQVGCLEAEAAGPALPRKVLELIGRGEDSSLRELCRRNPAGLTAETVVQAAREQDALALSVIEEVTDYLAMAVANLISLLNPEMVVLGGGLMQAGDLLLAPIRRKTLQWAQPVAAPQTRIELTELGEDAGLYGAARLAFGNSP